MARLERRIAQRAQERFRFYLVSLVFTLLAVAVHTAQFGISGFADMLELLGWLCLFLSGIAGLWSLEWYPIVYVGKARVQDHKDAIDGATNFEAASEAAREVEKTTEKLKGVQMGTSAKYSAHRYLFIVGLLFILLSRGYLPAKHICILLWH